jgi:hypothetical protein
MRLPLRYVIPAALVALVTVVVVGSTLLDPPQPLLVDMAFSHDMISPNADGVDDVTDLTYEISRNAFVSLTFSDGQKSYAFRDRERRSPGEYRVQFSGVVDGYLNADEDLPGEILRRLIPDGDYTWAFTVEAQDDGEVAEATGQLTVMDGDSPLPLLTTFSIGPDVFSPNQDGVADWTLINAYLTKDAQLTMYLVDDEGQRVYIARREEGREAGEAGRHNFFYEGGVDIGADPPEDGIYTVVAEASDEVGQVTRRTRALEIVNGGKPRAEIVGQPIGVDVVFDVMPYDERYLSDLDALGDPIPLPDDPDSLDNLPVTMAQGDVLVFRLTVSNYGPAPIRTAGPWPGTVYQQAQRASSLGFYDQSGVWRVGIDCETSVDSYPWRWAVGTPDDLYMETDPTNGNVYYYLAPGGVAEVWGGIRMTEIVDTRNPQDCWAGLIHEDVEISLQNQNVGRREVELAPNPSLVDN